MHSNGICHTGLLTACEQQSAENKVKPVQDSFRTVNFLQRSKFSWFRHKNNLELFVFTI